MAGVLRYATPAGSTAYNYSAHGPILPIGAESFTEALRWGAETYHALKGELKAGIAKPKDMENEPL